MSSPATRHISNQQTPATTSSTTIQSQHPSFATSLRSFLTCLSGSVRHALLNRRPWTELVDRTAFSKPKSLSDATTCVCKNFSYFRQLLDITRSRTCAFPPLPSFLPPHPCRCPCSLAHPPRSATADLGAPQALRLGTRGFLVLATMVVMSDECLVLANMGDYDWVGDCIKRSREWIFSYRSNLHKRSRNWLIFNSN